MSTKNPLPSADEFKTHATEAVRKVGDSLHEQAEVLRDNAASIRYNTQEFIEQNPWPSVALAASVGFLVGVIVARR